MKGNFLKNNSYEENTHILGRIWAIAAAILILAYPFACLLLFGGQIDWTIIVTGIGIVAMYWVVSVVETFTYTPMLGSGATYLSFVTGNLSNLKVPCALNCMEQAEVKAGSEEGEVISVISTAVSSIVTMFIIILGVILIAFLTPVLENPILKPAFDNLLPALFGSMAVVYISKNWKIAVVPATLMLVVFLTASLATGNSGLAGTLIGIMVPVGVIVSLVSARFMYTKGWLGERGDIPTANSQPSSENTTKEE
ncbi:MAG: hypothetical protein J6S22_03980 [Clostridia bacterium]|nr:hypothetical protein [Clostridia bacterium]